MGRIKYITIPRSKKVCWMVGMTLRDSGLISAYDNGKTMVLARYGVNKTTLKKLLAKYK